MVRQNHVFGEQKPLSRSLPGAIEDIMTPANFCEDRLRGFGVAMGRILAFSIDLLRRF